jgi:hypothetical protein
MRQPLGIVHVLIPGEPPEDRLANLGSQRVTAILTSPSVGESLSGKLCQAKGIIEVPKREQPSVGRHSRTMEFQLQAGIERDPESGIAFFTRCTVHLQTR